MKNKKLNTEHEIFNESFYNEKKGESGSFKSQEVRYLLERIVC